MSWFISFLFYVTVKIYSHSHGGTHPSGNPGSSSQAMLISTWLRINCQMFPLSWDLRFVSPLIIFSIDYLVPFTSNAHWTDSLRSWVTLLWDFSQNQELQMSKELTKQKPTQIQLFPQRPHPRDPNTSTEKHLCFQHVLTHFFWTKQTTIYISSEKLALKK